MMMMMMFVVCCCLLCSHEERFAIDVSDPELNVVTDASVWTHYRNIFPTPSCGRYFGQVEHEMFSASNSSTNSSSTSSGGSSVYELTLRARETVSVPFVFLSFASGPVLSDGSSLSFKRSTRKDSDGRDGRDSGWASSKEEESKEGRSIRNKTAYESKQGESKQNRDTNDNRDANDDNNDGNDDHRRAYLGQGMVAIRKRTIPISFKSSHHGHTVSLLQLHVRPRPFCVHRTFRFHQAENEFLKRRILLSTGSLTSRAHPYAEVPSRIGNSENSLSGPPTMPAKFVHCPSSGKIDRREKREERREKCLCWTLGLLLSCCLVVLLSVFLMAFFICVSHSFISIHTVLAASDTSLERFFYYCSTTLLLLLYYSTTTTTVHCLCIDFCLSDVVVEWRDQKDAYAPQEIHVRYRCGSFPTLGQFFLCVYHDQYHAQLHESTFEC